MELKKILLALIAIGLIVFSLNIKVSWKEKNTVQVSIEAKMELNQKQQ